MLAVGAVECLADGSFQPMTTHRRALLFFHHIKNKNKRTYIRERAQDLGVSGVCKEGFPGVLVVQGKNDDLNRYVSDIKASGFSKTLNDCAHAQTAHEVAELHVEHVRRNAIPGCCGLQGDRAGGRVDDRAQGDHGTGRMG